MALKVTAVEPGAGLALDSRVMVGMAGVTVRVPLILTMLYFETAEPEMLGTML